jgi:hypothetical protein
MNPYLFLALVILVSLVAPLSLGSFKDGDE